MSSDTLSIESYTNRIEVLYAASRFKETIEEIRRALSFASNLDGDSAKNSAYDFCYYAYVYVYISQDKIEEAIQIGNQGVAQNPESELIRRALIEAYKYSPTKENTKQVSILCEYLLQKNPNSTSNLECKIIELAMLRRHARDKKGYNDQIRSVQDAILELDPYNEEALVSRGIDLIKKKDYVGAEKLHISMIQREPNNSTYLINYASILRSTNRDQEAENILLQVLKSEPNNKIAQSNLKKFVNLEKNIFRVFMRFIPFIPIAPGFGIAYLLIVLPCRFVKPVIAIPLIVTTLSLGTVFLSYYIPLRELIIDWFFIIVYSGICCWIFISIVNYNKKIEDKRFQAYLEQQLSTYESGH